MLLRRSLLRATTTTVRRGFTPIFGRNMADQAVSQTPMEDAMRSKISATLSPTHLQIHNDSALHSHHASMAGNTSTETHFRVVITSDAFKGKTQPARHRMVYGLIKEEMSKEGGIHALQLRTRTVEEEEREKKKAVDVEGQMEVDHEAR